MLKFEKCDERESKSVLRSFGKPKSEMADIAYEFMDSGIEVAKLSGYSSTDAIKVYGSLSSIANNALKDEGFKVSKRGEIIYLLNTKLNPVACAPEKR